MSGVDYVGVFYVFDQYWNSILSEKLEIKTLIWGTSTTYAVG